MWRECFFAFRTLVRKLDGSSVQTKITPIVPKTNGKRKGHSSRPPKSSTRGPRTLRIRHFWKDPQIGFSVGYGRQPLCHLDSKDLIGGRLISPRRRMGETSLDGPSAEKEDRRTNSKEFARRIFEIVCLQPSYFADFIISPPKAKCGSFRRVV